MQPPPQFLLGDSWHFFMECVLQACARELKGWSKTSVAPMSTSSFDVRQYNQHQCLWLLPLLLIK